VNRAVIGATVGIVARAAMAIASAAVAVVTATVVRVVSVQKVAMKAAMPIICPPF